MTVEPKKTRSGRGTVLSVIAVCFLASAMLRSVLVAEAANTIDSDIAAGIAEETMSALAPAAAGEPLNCDAGSLIAQLKEREAEFERREAAINERTAKLDIIEEKLGERIDRLETARKALESTVKHVDGAQSRDIDHLVTMYSTMKPKRAGELFNQMDIKFASELLVRAKPETAALILSNMDSEKAFTASLMIARRNQSAPKN
jgi:flagellar motility protein MotE (MotC chaperone)